MAFAINPYKYNETEYIVDEKRKLVVNSRALTPV
jgi:hypothetical protein